MNRQLHVSYLVKSNNCRLVPMTAKILDNCYHAQETTWTLVWYCLKFLLDIPFNYILNYSEYKKWIVFSQSPCLNFVLQSFIKRSGQWIACHRMMPMRQIMMEHCETLQSAKCQCFPVKISVWKMSVVSIGWLILTEDKWYQRPLLLTWMNWGFKHDVPCIMKGTKVRRS